MFNGRPTHSTPIENISLNIIVQAYALDNPQTIKAGSILKCNSYLNKTILCKVSAQRVIKQALNVKVDRPLPTLGSTNPNKLFG